MNAFNPRFAYVDITLMYLARVPQNTAIALPASDVRGSMTLNTFNLKEDRQSFILRVTRVTH